MSSRFKKDTLPKVAVKKHSSVKIGIAVSEWHPEVTEELFEGALKMLCRSGIREKNIVRINSPGSFELPLIAKRLITKYKSDAVICLGCVIKGETDHYQFICEAVSKGIMDLSLSSGRPVGFGLLTVNNLKQALDRAGGKFGNKGIEAAEAVLKCL